MSAVKKTKETKGKYKENQRALLKIWHNYSGIMATLCGTSARLQRVAPFFLVGGGDTLYTGCTKKTRKTIENNLLLEFQCLTLS